MRRCACFKGCITLFTGICLSLHFISGGSAKQLIVSAFIEFENDRKNYCHNDPAFTVLGINLLSYLPGTFSISGGTGLTNLGNNRASISPGKLVPGHYTITYFPVNNYPVNAVFEVGNNLTTDFEWDKVCYQKGIGINFTSKTLSPFGLLTDTSYYWKLTINTGFTEYHTPGFSCVFPKPGNYAIELYVNNSFGCKDSTRKVFPLSPVIPLSGNEYFEDFESNATGWNSGMKTLTTQNSWLSGNPVLHGSPVHGFSGAFSGDQCWYTNIDNNPAPSEQSWVSSSCFDFNGTKQPMLIARLWRSFSNDKDGARLQASVDNGQTWTTIGIIGGGINWYNDNYGNTVFQVPGWTDSKDEGWIEIRHSLDELRNQRKVQLRFLYEASGTASGNDGIAFDDVRIRERTHKSIIEHFTNSSDPESAQADSILDYFTALFSSDIIDVQYHTSVPPNDPFYLSNPVIPTTRQLYYGLSTVPFAVMNGGTNSNQRFNYYTVKPDESTVIIESLNDSKFRIRVNSMTDGQDLYVKTTVWALQQIPMSDLAVRLVVFEPLIDNITGANGDKLFRNVVKAMLPGAAGTFFSQAWNNSDSVTFVERWSMKNVHDPEHIRVAAFIQNEVTQEIYQATVDTRGEFTGTEKPQEEGKRFFNLFPNPASEAVIVQFTEEIQETFVLTLFNCLGRQIHSIQVNPGTEQLSLPLDEYNNGVYLLKTQREGHIPVVSRIIIAR